jgi:hypothetical protein
MRTVEQADAHVRVVGPVELEPPRTVGVLGGDLLEGE